MPAKNVWGRAAYKITSENGPTKTINVSGRDKWALECLMSAGKQGCTPIDTPGPRWSGYVRKLRVAGVEVETIHEQHAGPFPGSHARYVLRSEVTRVQAEGTR